VFGVPWRSQPLWLFSGQGAAFLKEKQSAKRITRKRTAKVKMLLDLIELSACGLAAA